MLLLLLWLLHHIMHLLLLLLVQLVFHFSLPYFDLLSLAFIPLEHWLTGTRGS